MVFARVLQQYPADAEGGLCVEHIHEYLHGSQSGTRRADLCCRGEGAACGRDRELGLVDETVTFAMDAQWALTVQHREL